MPTSEAYLPSSIEPGAQVLVEIVADGGPLLGFGHIGRCLALWEELDGQAAFRVQDNAVAGFLRARGASLASVEAAPILLLDRAQPTDEREVRSMQRAGRHVVLLDDLGSGRMAAAAVIDPPTAAAWPPAAGRRLAGFEHVLLRREVREAATGAEPEGYLLLAMGGSDPASLTTPLSEALVGAGIESTVALGPGYQGVRPAESSLLCLIEPEAFVPALARAELLVCGYGHSLLEAAHLGVPAISVVFRADHLPHARAFCSNGTACMLDMTAGPRPTELVELAGQLLADGARRAQMAERGRELVDGAGATRIGIALHALV